MNPSDEIQDRELLERYRAASNAEPLAPRDAVRAAILDEGRRAAASFTSEPARRKSSRWRMTAFATAATVLLASLVIAPQLWQHERQVAADARNNSFRQAAVRKAQPEPPAYAAAAPVPVVPVEPAPRPKLEGVAPPPRAERLRPNVPPPPPIHYPEQSVEISPLNQSRSLTESRAAAAAPSSASGSAQRSQSSFDASRAAALTGNLPKASQLLDQRAVAVDEPDASGRTPLMLAVEQGQLDRVRVLLGRGADPNAADQNGVTPLKLAQQKGLTEIAAALTQAGAQ